MGSVLRFFNHRGTETQRRKTKGKHRAIHFFHLSALCLCASVVSSSIISSAMRHVLSALVQNRPGVLAQVSGMLATRSFNIDSLAVGETEHPELSRMTFVVHGDDAVLEQVRKQLDKLITVVKVLDISSENYVERDLMLIKVNAVGQQRNEIALLVEMFRARVVDVSSTNIMVEISGQESKIEAFIDLMRPYGIVELARTGRIALVRGLAKEEAK